MSTALDPFHALRPLREEEVERLMTNREPAGASPLAYDVYRAAGDLVIEFDAPGVAPSDMHVTVEGRAITVSLRRDLAKGPDIDVIEAGRQHGTFHRRLWLGDAWDVNDLTARADHGVLVVRAPLAAKALRRRVPVAGDTAPPAPPSSDVVDPAEVDEVFTRVRIHSAA